MWFGGTICLKVGIFFLRCLYVAFVIEHLLGSIWHGLFLFLPKFHGFVLYFRRILQKVIWCLLPSGMVMVLSSEWLPWNKRKGKKNQAKTFECFFLFVCLIGNIQYLDSMESAHGTLCAHSKSEVQPPLLWIGVCVPQITKGPKIWGSILVHMLLLSLGVCVADARNRLCNMLYKQIGEMIFVLKYWWRRWRTERVPALKAAQRRRQGSGPMSSTKRTLCILLEAKICSCWSYCKGPKF